MIKTILTETTPHLDRRSAEIAAREPPVQSAGWTPCNLQRRATETRRFLTIVSTLLAGTSPTSTRCCSSRRDSG